jgi:succinate dehydrogenase / fumarate reductase, iron-sulfur subunit
MSEANREEKARTVRFRVARGRGEGRTEEFLVPVEAHTTIVDALEWIRTHRDAGLMYRHSCHHGSCGTCGMLVNGEQKLACTTPVDDAPVVDLKPLQTMKLMADLAVDPTPLFRDFPAHVDYLRPSEFNRGSETPEEIDRYVRFENCIECGLCVSSCPVVGLRGFMGPAALAAYNREIEKNPDRTAELLAEIDSTRGASGCDRHLECSRVCPTGVYPAKHIAQLMKKLKKRN